MIDWIKAGDTSVIVPLFIQDSTKTDGSGLGSLVFNSSGLVAKYKRQGDASYTSITLVTATIGTWTSGGFKEDTSGSTGDYELHLPNAAVAAGAKWVIVEVYGATNMVAIRARIPLKAVDPQDAVRFGQTALPNTACTTNASLLTSGTGTDQLSVTSGRVDIGKALGTAVTLDANNVLNVSAKYMGGTLLTARDIGASVLLSSGTGTGQVKISAGYVSPNWADVGSPTSTVGLTGTTISTGQTITSVSGSVGSVTGAVGSVTAGVTVTTNNDKTGYSLANGSIVTATFGTCDFTATMKTSLNAATPASVTGAVGSVTGAVGSVTGNVGGSVASVVGAVGSVTAGVTLAANQHVIVDSGTVTNLTNLPSIPANWITAAGINAAALNGKGDWLLSSSYVAPLNSTITAIAGVVANFSFVGSLVESTPQTAVQVGSYSIGQDPASMLLLNPTLKLYTDAAGGTKLTANTVDLTTLTAALKQVLFTQYFTTTGSTTPVSADNWYVNGLYNNQPLFRNLGNSLSYWFNGTNWTLSASQGTNGSAYWTSATASPWSALTGHGTATGTPVITPHGTAALAQYQPDVTNLKGVTDSLNVMISANQFTTAALANAPTGSGGLTGPSSVTLTFNDANNNPVQNVEFTVVGQGIGPRTDSNGQAAFGLPNGTYTVTAGPVGLTMFANATLVVSGTTTLTITGTAATIPTPGSGQISGYMYTRDGEGNLRPGQMVSFQLLDPKSLGDGWSNAIFSATSDSSAFLTVNLWPGAQYRFKIGTGAWKAFVAGSSGPYQIPNIVG